MQQLNRDRLKSTLVLLIHIVTHDTSFLSGIQMFNYSDKIVRIVYIEGEIWFVANDIGSILALTDTRKSAKLLDKDDRNTVPVMDALGRYQDTTIINEPNIKHGKNQADIAVINK